MQAKIAGWKPEISRSSHRRCSVKQCALKNFENFTGKNLCWSLFLIKFQFWGPVTLLKKTPTELLSYEISKLFKSNYFEEHLWMSSSKLYLKRDSNIGVFLWILWINQEHLFCRGFTNGWFWTPLRGSLSNKVASLMSWRSWTV